MYHGNGLHIAIVRSVKYTKDVDTGDVIVDVSDVDIIGQTFTGKTLLINIHFCSIQDTLVSVKQPLLLYYPRALVRLRTRMSLQDTDVLPLFCR